MFHGNRFLERFEGLVQLDSIGLDLRHFQPDAPERDIGTAVVGIAIGSLAKRDDGAIGLSRTRIGEAEADVSSRLRIESTQRVELSDPTLGAPQEAVEVGELFTRDD